MKIAVSVPDDVFSRADELAAELGVSRSHVYTSALEEYLERRLAEEDPVTTRINEVVERLATEPDVGRAAGRRLIDSGQWEW